MTEGIMYGQNDSARVPNAIQRSVRPYIGPVVVVVQNAERKYVAATAQSPEIQQIRPVDPAMQVGRCSAARKRTQARDANTQAAAWGSDGARVANIRVALSDQPAGARSA